MNANFIVIGGPVAVGKSILASSLGMPVINELDKNDFIQDIIIQKTYEKNRITPEVIEMFFLMKRILRYKKYANTSKTRVFDRSIFESILFAESNISKKSFLHFKKLWEQTIKNLISKNKKPLLYILLTCSWETFKKRIFARGRDVEIKNFYKNKNFWKKHILKYEIKMKDIFQKFKIDYININTDKLNKKELHDKVIKILQKRDIIND